MSGILQFFVQYEDGAYTASAINAPIATFGRTFEELQANITDAIAVFFKDEDPASLGFARFPSVLVNFELPIIAYGNNEQSR
ncbi:MAG: hypothetical protein C5B44_05200 [Acidobacteria bacterium]|nr:MAG: hypothetical protein C5B44_05200 [Acidobacteriota bacterium]